MDEIDRYGMALLTNGNDASRQARQILEVYGIEDVCRVLEVDYEDAPELASKEGVKTDMEEIERFAHRVAQELA
jgi:hypothetical protein